MKITTASEALDAFGTALGDAAPRRSNVYRLVREGRVVLPTTVTGLMRQYRAHQALAAELKRAWGVKLGKREYRRNGKRKKKLGDAAEEAEGEALGAAHR